MIAFPVATWPKSPKRSGWLQIAPTSAAISPPLGAWLSLSACAGCELIAGQVYGFGLFSDVFRRERGLGLRQDAVESVAVAEILGQYVRLAGGLVYDRCGARVALRAGLALVSLGYLSLYAAVRLADSGAWRPPFWLLCAAAGTYGQGAGWMETAVISSTVASFPDEAAGLLKTFFGMASGVGAVAFAALLSPSQEALLLALGLVPLVVGFPLSGLVREPGPLPGGPPGDLWSAAYGLCLCMAVVLGLHSLLAGSTSLLRPYEAHRGPNVAVFLVVCGLLTAFPLLPRLLPADSGPKQGAAAKPLAAKSTGDYPFSEAIRTPAFWCLFFALAAGEGAGLMVLNNMGQLVRALDNGSAELQPVCVSFFSVANASGRLAMGRLAAWLTWPKTRLLAWPLGAASVVCAAFSLGEDRQALLAATPCLGFCYGCLWSLQPLLVAELFGRRSYGAKYATLSLAAVFGSVPLCQLAVPAFYDAHADPGGWCVGRGCFGGSLLVASLQCAAGAAAALWLDGCGRPAERPKGAPMDC